MYLYLVVTANDDDDDDVVQPLSVDLCADDVDAYVVVYSVTDRSSFVYAQTCLADLKRRRKTLSPSSASPISSAVVLVANKQDLVRNRAVSESGQPPADRFMRWLQLRFDFDSTAVRLLISDVTH